MATVMGPSEMPHGMVVIVMSRWEAERLSDILSDVVRGSMQDDPDLAAIAAAFASLREEQ